MSCEHEIANKWARCSRKSVSYIARNFVEMRYFLLVENFKFTLLSILLCNVPLSRGISSCAIFFQVFMGPPGTDLQDGPRGQTPI